MRSTPRQGRMPPMSLVELRVLVGPNADIPGPAIRVTLDGPIERGVDPAEVVDRIAHESGTWVGPSVSRPGAGGTVVVAFPWVREGTGRALGHALVEVLDGSPRRTLATRISRAADTVRDADPGDPPTLVDPRVPTVAVTGTNGKTTTTRLLARMAAESGRLPGWSTTDGVYIDGACVEPGDWSGPGGARRVLEDPRVRFAVLETARGGLMLRGMGVASVDVAVFTNVSPDHLGQHGIDTVEQLAWAKSAVVRVVRARGWAVLNADDPLVRQYHAAGPGRPWFFATDTDSEGAALARYLRAPLTSVNGAGHAVVEGWVDLDVDLGRIDRMPITIAGLSQENVANALAAASAALAAGLPLTAVRSALHTFTPDPGTSPGRMNIWSVPIAGGRAHVILDFAHNEAGIAALLRVARGLCPPGAAVHVSIGNAGDRTDAGIREVARLAALGADTVQLAAKPRYLRGRTQEEIDVLQREGVALGGGTPPEEVADEASGLQALLARARPGDVLAVMVHEDREGCTAALERAGGQPCTPDDVTALARAAAGR